MKRLILIAAITTLAQTSSAFAQFAEGTFIIHTPKTIDTLTTTPVAPVSVNR